MPGLPCRDAPSNGAGSGEYSCGIQSRFISPSYAKCCSWPKNFVKIILDLKCHTSTWMSGSFSGAWTTSCRPSLSENSEKIRSDTNPIRRKNRLLERLRSARLEALGQNHPGRLRCQDTYEMAHRGYRNMGGLLRPRTGKNTSEGTPVRQRGRTNTRPPFSQKRSGKIRKNIFSSPSWP